MAKIKNSKSWSLPKKLKLGKKLNTKDLPKNKIITFEDENNYKKTKLKLNTALNTQLNITGCFPIRSFDCGKTNDNRIIIYCLKN